MSEFVDEGEYLRRLGVGSVHEHDGRQFVDQRKASKLCGVELAAGVGADHAVDHHQHARLLGSFRQLPESGAPAFGPLLPREVQAGPHRRRGLERIAPRVGGTHQFDFVQTVLLGVVSVPVLPPLALVDGVEQVDAGSVAPAAADGAEIRDRQHLVSGGLRQEEPADRGVGGFGVLLQLPEGRRKGARFPFGQLGEPACQIFAVAARAPAGPRIHLCGNLSSERHAGPSMTRCGYLPAKIIPANAAPADCGGGGMLGSRLARLPANRRCADRSEALVGGLVCYEIAHICIIR